MPATSPGWRLARLIEGYLTTQLLYVVAKLGVADALADGPRRGEALAAAVGVEPGPLTRLLRGLVLEEVFSEGEDGSFALTEVGSLLRENVPGSLRRAVIARGELYYEAAGGLLRAIREGGTAFDHVYGERFFEHLDRHAEHGAAFQGSMAGRAEREAEDVVAAYDFGGFRTLVDVAGGQGVLIRTILRATPALRSTLFDLPDAIPEARERLEADGLTHRCELVAGDFFEAVPSGADAYLLSRVIHDWQDADARRILATCRAAMPEGAVLLLVEAILPERAAAGPEAIRMDLLMLTLLGGRERTIAEYERLLADSGFRVTRVVPTRSPAGLSVIEASPSRR